MKRIVVFLIFAWVFVSCVSTPYHKNDVVVVPNIGDDANTPFTGFTRYDDETDKGLFVYDNMYTFANGDGNNFLNGNMHVQSNASMDASVLFTMQGTQFYLIVQSHGGRNSNIDLYIDGQNNQTFSAPQDRHDGHIVYFVSPELSDGIHTVMLKYNPGISGELAFDGIDVYGELVVPPSAP